MKFWKTIRVKLFLLFFATGFLPVFLHLLISYYFSNENDKRNSFINFFLNHALVSHHNFFYEIVIILFLAFLIAVYITKPLRVLNKIIHQLENKKITKKIKFKSEDEIGQLSEVLNKMLEEGRKDKTMIKARSKKIIDSDKKHRELLNLFADVIYELDENQRLIKVKNAENIFGYKEKDLIGKKCLNFIHPEDHQVLREEFNKMKPKSNKPVRDFKIRMLTKTGEIRYCLLSFRTIFEKNKLIRREGVLRDITTREELAQKVINEKEKLETMYQNLHESYLALGKINAQVAALAEINTTFSSNLDWKDKLSYIIESIRTFMQANETLLFVISHDNKKFNLKHASVDLDFWEEIELTRNLKLMEDLIKYKKPLKYFKVNNLLDKAKAEAKSYKAMLAIPVIINNEVIGVFIVFFASSKKLEDSPTRLTLAYTSQMSIALMMSGELDHSLKKIF